MYDNYPPGVTGNEYPVAGPDGEYESDYLCPICNSTQTGYIITYNGFSWFNCSACDTDTDIDIERSFPTWVESQYQ
jgi:transcription elongation factor Elf1